jgi:hypothetical protein
MATRRSYIGRLLTNVPNWLERAASQNFESPSLPQPGGTIPAGGVRDDAATLIFMNAPADGNSSPSTLLTRRLPPAFSANILSTKK